MIVNKLDEYLNNTDHNDMNHIIAKYMKKNLDKIADMKIDDIASQCYVSKGKISKFCKKLGYDNFQAFKDDCINDHLAKKMVKLRQQYHLEKDFQQHIDDSLQTIQTNLASTDIEMINQLVDDIFQAKYIFVYGVAYSYLLCRYFQYECEFLNKDVIIIDEKFHRDYHMPEQSFILVFTVEGYAFESDHRLLRRLKKYPVKKWCLSTDFLSQKVKREFDKTLLIPSKNTELKDRRILIRYMIDIILGRYQYLYVKK